MSLRRSRLLLLVENPDLGGILELALREYETDLHATVDPARDAFRRRAFDLAIVDLSLGSRPAGIELIREWKRSGGNVPIIVLSDLPQPGLSIEALDAGADDFLRKPFHHAELLVRIRKQLARQRSPDPLRRAGGVLLGREAFGFGPATVSPDLTIRFPGRPAERLRPKQLGILKFFAERAGGLALKDDLVKAVWGSDAGGEGHSVNEYVSTLRRLFLRHRVDFNRLVTNEPKVGWRIDAAVRT
ncbi:MAG: response regulator transcription factor [Opitutaceae bacterium]